MQSRLDTDWGKNFARYLLLFLLLARINRIINRQSSSLALDSTILMLAVFQLDYEYLWEFAKKVKEIIF